MIITRGYGDDVRTISDIAVTTVVDGIITVATEVDGPIIALEVEVE